MSREVMTREELLTMLNRELQHTSDNAVLFNQAVAAQVGIHPTNLKVLSLLTQSGAMTAGRLAELTGLTTGAITFIIDRLEKAGYAQRIRHPHDRRSILIELHMEQVMHDLGQFFTSMGKAMEDLATHYTDKELMVILDFITRSNEATRQEIASISKKEVSGEGKGEE